MSITKTFSGNTYELGFKWHYLVSDFKKRVVTDGGQLSDLEIFALNWYCHQLDRNGLTGKYIALYPLVGGSASTQSIANFKHNLISSSYKLTANNVTAAMCTALGYQGNATNSYWNTGIIPTTNLTSTDVHLSYYSRSASATDAAHLSAGIPASTNNTEQSLRFATQNGPYDILRAYGNSTQLVFAGSNSQGLKTGTRSGTTSVIYRNGGSVASSASMAGVVPNIAILLGASNEFGTVASYSDRQYTMFSIGANFTSAQELIRYKIQQNFETLLSRQI